MAAPPTAPAPVRTSPLARAVDDRVRQLRQASRTTPGRFGGIGIGLLLLIALTGLLTAAGAAQRANAIDSLVNESEPRASAAQQLYLALSEADATASRAFLSGGLEPPEVRQRYDDAIARAGTALAVSSSGASDETAEQLTKIAAQLPVYTGLVEAARANGVPVEYIVFDDEGHGFLKKENRERGYKAVLDFLDQYLKNAPRTSTVG